jgi:hypothetical protein
MSASSASSAGGRRVTHSNAATTNGASSSRATSSQLPARPCSSINPRGEGNDPLTATPWRPPPRCGALVPPPVQYTPAPAYRSCGTCRPPPRDVQGCPPLTRRAGILASSHLTGGGRPLPNRAAPHRVPSRERAARPDRAGGVLAPRRAVPLARARNAPPESGSPSCLGGPHSCSAGPWDAFVKADGPVPWRAENGCSRRRR